MSRRHAAQIAAYVERVVAAAPPLTNEQRDKLAVILRREQGVPIPPPKPSPEVIERQRREAEERQKRAAAIQDARKRAAAILACHGCGHPPEASIHGSGPLQHEWEPTERTTE